MNTDSSLLPLFDALARANPFLENRVTGGSQPGLDVASIHQRAFEQLTGLAGQVLAARRSIGAVLWGEAGTGKSHLLARLDRWAGQGQGLFVYLHNLQAAPDALPRALLHAVVTRLTAGRRTQLAGTPLYAMVRAGLLEAAGSNGPFDRHHLQQMYEAWVDRLGPEAGDRTVHDVLLQFFHSTYDRSRNRGTGEAASLALRWLSGGALDPAEARTLGLPPPRRADEAVALEDAQQIKQVLLALSRLAISQGRPFILALDQVDNLADEQFAALSRFLEAILDAAQGMFVVTAGIQATLLRWSQDRVVQTSAWDRLAQFQVQLRRLSPTEAEQLVRGRIDDFLNPFLERQPVQRLRRLDPLFPLGRAWADRQLFERIDIRPRDAISLAREGWQREQNLLARLEGYPWLAGWPHSAGEESDDLPDLAPQELQARIETAIIQEMRRIGDRLAMLPGDLPPDGDRLASILHDLLRLGQPVPVGDRCRVTRLPPPRPGAAPTYHLHIEQADGTEKGITGVLVLTARNSTSVAGFLRRLLEDPAPLSRVVILTDARVGIPLGARGQDYLAQLEHRDTPRLERIELSFPAVSALETLHTVVSRARSGDLEIELRPGQARTVTEDEVCGSMAWRRCWQEQPVLRLLANIPEGAEVNA